MMVLVTGRIPDEVLSKLEASPPVGMHPEERPMERGQSSLGPQG